MLNLIKLATEEHLDKCCQVFMEFKGYDKVFLLVGDFNPKEKGEDEV